LWQSKKRTFKIRIVDTPPGEAPASRAQCLGRPGVAPGPGETGPRLLQQVEVLSLQTTGAAQGYLVDGRQAVALLATQNPEAAAWCRPLRRGAGFRAHMAFPPEVCERVAG